MTTEQADEMFRLLSMPPKYDKEPWHDEWPDWWKEEVKKNFNRAVQDCPELKE